MADVLTIYRGNTKTITVTVTDSEGSAFDLTGFTMTLMAKREWADDDSEAVITRVGTIASPTSGIGVIELTHADTDVDTYEYKYEIQINNGTTQVYTLIQSILYLKQSVKHITS